MPIDILLHTPGGLVLAAEQIAHAIMKHPAKVTIFVPHYAMSGGTLLALSADEIIMDENAVLGPADLQSSIFQSRTKKMIPNPKSTLDIHKKLMTKNIKSSIIFLES